MSDDTIYAVSSGRPPAAISIIRISGRAAYLTLATLAGTVPEPRIASLRTIRSAAGDVLDRGLVLWFPGPASATGEDVAELHLHGGIAVIDAVSLALRTTGLRHAESGEFTRRAVLNGRLDLNEAENLADLLSAETATQHREVMLRVMGALGRAFEGWTMRLLAIAAEIERAIDYEEEDAGHLPDLSAIADLRDDILAMLRRPAVERLRDGIRVAIVGPVNAGKSSLFNAILGTDAAIVTPIPGTTRDIVERPVVIGDIAFVLMDTAGTRDTEDIVESLGIARASWAEEIADIVLDLSDDAVSNGRRIAIAAKADVRRPVDQRLPVSSKTGLGILELADMLQDRARTLLPPVGEAALNKRQRTHARTIACDLDQAANATDILIVAEHLMTARRALDMLTGRAGVDDLLDSLFSRFCLGK